MAVREANVLHVQLSTNAKIPAHSPAADGDRTAVALPLRRHRAATRSAGFPGPAGPSGPAGANGAGGSLKATSPAADAEFKAELIALIPHLRAFARSLEMGAGGDDLAQDAMLRGWKARAHYERGTNLKAWLFTILRNQFLSGKRRSWRSLPLDPGVAEATLVSHDDPGAREELLDVRSAMRQLPDEQREALILVGPAGMSYEEAAQIVGCAVGTVKSRVSRARSTLVRILAERETGPRAKVDVEATQVFATMMDEATGLRSKLEADQAGA